MKKDELIAAATRAKFDIDDQIDEFIDALERGTAKPDEYMSLTQIENMWHSLGITTRQSYSDMMNQLLSSLDTQELNSSKKANSSRVE